MRKESVKNHGKSIRSKLLNVAQNEGIYMGVKTKCV